MADREILNKRTRAWRDPYEYGRIRLYDHTSWLLRRLLNKERLRLYIERREAQRLGSSVTSWNREIGHVSQILDEVNRLRKEKGWVTTSESPINDDGVEPDEGN
jgi:hypothetical protein